MSRVFNNRRRLAKLRFLLARDGPDCWLCGVTTPRSDRTIEHLFPRSRGGSNDAENLFLTHRVCNQRLGDLSPGEKHQLRNAVRSGRLTIGI